MCRSSTQVLHFTILKSSLDPLQAALTRARAQKSSARRGSGGSGTFGVQSLQQKKKELRRKMEQEQTQKNSVGFKHKKICGTQKVSEDEKFKQANFIIAACLGWQTRVA